MINKLSNLTDLQKNDNLWNCVLVNIIFMSKVCLPTLPHIGNRVSLKKSTEKSEDI